MTTQQDTIESTRSLIGGNQPEGSLLPADALLAKLTNPDTGILLEMMDGTTRLLAEIGGKVDGVAGVPAKIETAADDAINAKYMERLRNTIKSVNVSHDAWKAPYLTAGRVVDNTHSAMTDRLEKAKEILQKRGNDYVARKAAEERAERARIAQAERDRLADIAKAERAAVERAAELTAAAARARKPERIEELQAAAATAHVAAQTAQVDTMIQASATESAVNATKATTADMVRTRYESGNLSTGKQVPYVEIVDKTKLDFIALLPYIKDEILLAAVKRYAVNTSHKIPMAGTIIEFRDAADYR